MKQVFCPRNRSHAPNPPVGWTWVSSITEARFTIQTWKRRPSLCDSTPHSKPLIHLTHSKPAHDVHPLSHSSTQNLWLYALHNPMHKYSDWLMSYFRPTGHNPTTSPMLLHTCTAFFGFSLPSATQSLTVRNLVCVHAMRSLLRISLLALFSSRWMQGAVSEACARACGT